MAKNCIEQRSYEREETDESLAEMGQENSEDL